MESLKEVKQHLNESGEISNEAAGYQFVKRSDGTMMQYSNGKYTFYKTLDGLAKAALYRIKRG